MIKYLEKEKGLESDFITFSTQQIFRIENIKVDLLSRLATLEAVDLKRSLYLETLDHSSIEEAPIMQIEPEPS